MIKLVRGFFTLLLVMVLNQATCQIEQGTIHIGVGASPVVFQQGFSETGIQYKALCGLLVHDNLSIGLNLNSIIVEDMVADTYAGFFRYHFINKKTGAFAETTIGLGDVFYTENPEMDGDLTYVSLGSGVYTFFLKKFTVELTAEYAWIINANTLDTRIGNTFMPAVSIHYFWN